MGKIMEASRIRFTDGEILLSTYIEETPGDMHDHREALVRIQKTWMTRGRMKAMEFASLAEAVSYSYSGARTSAYCAMKQLRRYGITLSDCMNDNSEKTIEWIVEVCKETTEYLEGILREWKDSKLERDCVRQPLEALRELLKQAETKKLQIPLEKAIERFEKVAKKF